MTEVSNIIVVVSPAHFPTAHQGHTLSAKPISRYHFPFTDSPVLSLALGPKLDASNIREGDDVYLECDVRARPPVDKIAWLLDGRAVQQDLSRGVFLSNRTLVIQRVRRVHAGEFVCTARNVEGERESNAVKLDVKCKENTPQVVDLIYLFIFLVDLAFVSRMLTRFGWLLRSTLMFVSAIRAR